MYVTFSQLKTGCQILEDIYREVSAWHMLCVNTTST